VEDWVLGVDDGLGFEDYECAGTGTGCGVLGVELEQEGFCWGGWVVSLLLDELIFGWREERGLLE
jgi:hypothetical protein